jgi:hypothetical protein
MRGARWHPDPENIPPEIQQGLDVTKCWSIENCPRNHTQLNILMGKENPFEIYDREIKPITAVPRKDYFGTEVMPYPHQCLMTGHQLGFRRVITAAEMGCGKTLAVIMTMEFAENDQMRDFWYVSTRSGLMSTMLELKRWGCKIVPTLFSYEELVSLLKGSPDIEMPKLIVFDESVAVKNATTQRSQAAMYIAERMRREVEEPYIIEMSGAPMPQAPTDIWHQVEIVAPGFLRESTADKLAVRLSVTAPRAPGQAYTQRITWKDNPKKCNTCGKFSEEHIYDDHPFIPAASDPSKCAACNIRADIHVKSDHIFSPSVDEVSALGRRLRGVMLVTRKADVMKWLPEKIFHRLVAKPEIATLRAAKFIANLTIPVIQRLTMLRTLSDGFKYTEQETTRTKTCPSCEGEGTILDYDEGTDSITNVTCPQCKGKTEVTVTERMAEYGPCPKDALLRELLDEAAETTGRIVTYAGFTGSVDRCVNVARSAGWDVLRVDGRGWKGIGPIASSIKAGKWLEVFQYDKIAVPKLAFMAQASSGGKGITLTAAEIMVYFSNDFNADSRIQSMDRIHRPGCTGANYFDLIHLPSDVRVLDALERKMDVQGMVLDASLFESED